MLKTIAKILLLALLAYFLEDILNTILPLPTENMVDGLLDLSTDSGLFWFRIFRYIIWIIFLALFFKYIGPIFNFVVPTARRYTATKFFRRFQGLLSEFILLGFIFLVVGTLLSIIPAYKTYDKSFSTYKKYALHSFTKDKEVGKIQQLISNNILAAGDYVESLEKEDALYAPLGETVDYSYAWPFSKDLNDAYPKRELGDDDIRQNRRYKEYVQKHIDLTNRLEELEEAPSSNIKGVRNEIANNYAMSFLEERDGGVSTIFFTEFKNIRTIALLATIFIFAGIHYYNRRLLGKRFEKIIRFFEKGRFGRGGSARFAGLFEEWATLFKNQKQGLFMGRSLYNPFLYLGLEDDRHMLTIAGSRAGKGTSAIIPNLLLWEGSALVIDPKGTNTAVTADRRWKMEQKVEVIDPFNISYRDSGSFNPLELLDPESPTIREDINVIAEALVVPDEKQKEKHWDDGARTVIAGLIAHLVTSPKYEHPTLPMIRDMISLDPEDQAELWADMSLNDGAGRLAKDAANRIIRGINTNEISSILSNADKHTEWLSSPAIKKVLSSSSFQFTDLKEKPTTLYLVLPPQYLQTHNRFLRLFVNLAINQMSKGGRSKLPVLLMMDEFLALGKMEEVEKAFGLMAGYNLVMWPFVQDMGRLHELYGKSVNAFIANSRAVQVFGVSDEETKEFVSDYIGNKSSGSGDSKNQNYRHIVKLRDPVEVAKDISTESNTQYILRSGKAPLILEKVKYYDSAPIKWLKKLKSFDKKRWGGPFDGLYDPDPDYSGK